MTKLQLLTDLITKYRLEIKRFQWLERLYPAEDKVDPEYTMLVKIYETMILELENKVEALPYE